MADLAEIDEVWLGLDMANALLTGEHRPVQRSFNGDGCSGCDVLFYVRNAMRAYKARVLAGMSR